MYAIIENGGKQYKAVEGRYIEIDLLPDDVGKKKTFNKVLLLSTEENVQVGDPYIKDVSVDATVAAHFSAPKITVFKYRAKQRYRIKTGHRQKYSRILIDSIAFPDKAKVVKKEAEAAPAKKTTPAAKKPSAKKASTTATRKKTTPSKAKAPAKKKAAAAAKKPDASKTKRAASKPKSTVKKTTTSKKPAASTSKKTTETKNKTAAKKTTAAKTKSAAKQTTGSKTTAAKKKQAADKKKK